MTSRIEQNIEGRFYVDTNCINCSLCPEIAPDIFATNHDLGCEYVKKQPCHAAELEQVAEAIEICPANAIQDTNVIQKNGQFIESEYRGRKMLKKSLVSAWEPARMIMNLKLNF